MDRARRLLIRMFLRAPAPLRSLRNWPILGKWVHRVSHAVVPPHQIHWVQVERGPAKGLWLELNPRTGEAYLRGSAEEAVQHSIASLLRPRMVFYDLGANIGLFSLLSARIVGPEGRIFSFEPDPVISARLRRNIARNGFSNATVVNMGVWSSTTKLSFEVADSSSPDRGTGRFVAGCKENLAEFDCVALDDFIETHPAPDAIKCDVEGAEVEVLRGAEKLIRNHRPWILGEMHSDLSARAWTQHLRSFGYTFRSVDENHILALP